MSSIGKISLDMNVNSKGFNKQVNGIQKQTTKAFSSMSIAVGNIVSNLVQKAVASIGNFVKDSINKGSELSELQNVVDSVFTTMSDKVESFSKNALAAYGLTEAQSKKMVGTFGAMSKSFGFTEEQAYDMSTALTGLAGDVASFYNLSHNEAYTKLKSVFTGETESLKELGVVMTQTALDEFALAKGFGKTTSKMSEQEKVALRLAFVQDKLSTAAGDFRKTQGQWANQTRILTGQFESFKAAIGQGLINVLTPVVRMLNTLMEKLVQAANAFKAFTEMVMGGRSSGGGIGSAMKEVADAANSAAGSTSGIEDAADGAADSAKKAQKALMGFDEINKLTGNNPASDMSDISFEGIDFGSEAEEAEKVTSPFLEAISLQLDKIIAKVKELIALFNEGFKKGLGDDFEESLERIKEGFEDVVEDVEDILGDAKIENAVEKWVRTVAYSIGQNAGAIASIGQTMSENLIGGVSLFLEQNKGYVKDRIVNILDASAEVYQISGELSTAIASIFEVFRGDTAKQITADLIAIIANAKLGMVEIATKIGGDILSCIAEPIINNQDKIKVALENTLKPIETIAATLSESVKTSFEKVFQVYEQYIEPAFVGIKDGLSSVVSALLSAYNSYIAPVLDRLAAKFNEVWVVYVQPIINKAIELIGKIAELISVLWQEYLVPLINWIAETIIPIIAPIIEQIGTMALELFGILANIISGFIDALTGLIDFIIGVFTGDWQRAWEGIQQIFKGIWEAISSFLELIWEKIVGTIQTRINLAKGIIETVFNAVSTFVSSIWNKIKETILTIVNAIKTGISNGFNSAKEAISNVMNKIDTVVRAVFGGVGDFIKNTVNGILSCVESMVNGVINALNSMIDAMNNLSFDIPSWVPGLGGKSFGFDIKKLGNVKLPRLAEGGYVRANQPQPVIVGDNKTQGEIITPEGKMLSVVLEALKTFFGQLQQSGYKTATTEGVGDIVIPIYLDGSMLEEVIVSAQQRRNIRSGGR